MAAPNWTSMLISGAGLWDQLNRYDELGSYVESQLGEMEGQVVEGSRFRPFAVAGYGGGASVGGDGSVTMNLDPTQQAMADSLTSQSQTFFDRAAGDTTGREQSIYDRVRAMQMPGEERAMTGLESRAFAQGRLGMQSSMYGGASPEMLAMQQAIAENRNNAAFTAIEQARAQQAQDATLGMNYQTSAYMPQAQALNLLNPGLQAANMGQAGQLAGMNLAAQLGLGSVQTQVNSEKIRGELLANLLSTVGNQFSQTESDPVRDILGTVWDKIFG